MAVGGPAPASWKVVRHRPLGGIGAKVGLGEQEGAGPEGGGGVVSLEELALWVKVPGLGGLSCCALMPPHPAPQMGTGGGPDLLPSPGIEAPAR